MTGAKVYPVFIPQAGCPHRCLYCNQELVTAQAAPPSPTRLKATLDDWLPKSGDGEIAYYGGSFTLLGDDLQRDYLELAGHYVAQGRARGIRLSTRPDGLQPRQLQRLAGYPVTTVEVGCQSFSEPVLNASRRGYRSDIMEDAICRLRGFGPWRLGLQLMPGLPGGTPVEALASLRTALRLKPDFLRIYPTLVLAGTGLEKLYLAGDYQPMALPDAIGLIARMSALATLAEVPIERIGLPGEADWAKRRGGLLAGPYHPAFGQLVRSELWLRILRPLLQQTTDSRQVTVPLRQQSDALGHRRSNLQLLSADFGPLRIGGDRNLPEHLFMVGDRVFDRHGQISNLFKDDWHATSN